MKTEEEYDNNQMINYLMKTINNNEKDSNQNINNIFLYEFFIFDLFTPIEVLKKIKQPILALRFLDFPTQTIEGKIDLNKESIHFDQGKSCFFEMEEFQLKEYLQSEPLYIMFVDMNYGDMRILASSRVNVSIFSYDNFVNHSGTTPPQPRRNILKLFDNVSAKVAEVDLTLIIRREYFKYENKNLFKDKNILIKEEINKEEINKKELVIYNKNENNIKIEAGVNTQEQFNNIQISKNINCDNIYNNYENLNDKNNFVNNLKNLLEGKEKNPPPLYFHNRRIMDRNDCVNIKIINESKNNQTTTGINTENKITNNKITIKENKNNLPLSKQVEYIKKTVNQKITDNNENKLKLKIKSSINSYDKKMKELNRYETNSNRNNSILITENSKNKFIDEDEENLEGNEYYNIYSKINNNKIDKVNIIKKDSNNSVNVSLTSNKSKSIKTINTIESQKSKNLKETEKYDKDKFYEVSNTHQFEISSNIHQSNNGLIRSYNSFSVSNSEKFNLIPNKKTLVKNLKFENKNELIESHSKLNSILDNTENIEEEIIVNNSNNILYKSGSKRRSEIGEEIMEEYDDFNYDYIEEEY